MLALSAARARSARLPEFLSCSLTCLPYGARVVFDRFLGLHSYELFLCAKTLIYGSSLFWKDVGLARDGTLARNAHMLSLNMAADFTFRRVLKSVLIFRCLPLYVSVFLHLSLDAYKIYTYTLT